MKRFIEINFGQFGETQREIIPIDALKNAYVELPEKRNIRITYNNGRDYSRTEYYRTEAECTRRWMEIRDAVGLGEYGPVHYRPWPLPEDRDKCPEYIERLEKIEEILNNK